jgi:hypothetical protein
LHGVVAGRGLGRRVELRSAVGRGRDHGLVGRRRHILGYRARHAAILLLVIDMLVLVLMMMLLLLLLLLEVGYSLELWASKSTWRTRLKRASEKQLRRQQRSELHIESCARSGQVRTSARCHCLSLIHSLSVERRNIAPTRMAICEAGNI